jgi:uncharacterized protein YjbI with pentapeptide repeats
MALAIGIDSYAHFKGLSGATTDAWAITAMLAQKGKFDVTTIADPATGADLRAGIAKFVAGLQPGDHVVIYYAGHGIQSNGVNYLVPPDLPASESSLPKLALTVNALLADVGKKAPGVTILILDACRDNPLGGGGAAGLASMQSSQLGSNTWIEFAAEANKTAADGKFMEQLIVELQKPGLPINEVFQNVRSRLNRVTQGGQVTLSLNKLEINFYFIPGEAVSADSALATLQRAAEALPQGDLGQTRAVEALVGSGRSLAGTDLLQGLPLVKARLDGAQLSTARMIGTNLNGAQLQGADLSGANLAMTILNGADATKATFARASLIFTEATGANFTGVNAEDSNWLAARADTGIFAGAHLQRAGFMFANLRGANFNGAHLEGAFFVGSDLTGATFEGATLDNTDFTGAIVSGVKLTPAQIKHACETTLDGLGPGMFARSFGVTITEVIPSTRFDGGYEYRDFLNKRYPFNLESNGLPACRKRELKERIWYPVWSSSRGEQVKTDGGLNISQKLMQQAGRRASVRDRVEQHFAWLWKTQQGK